MTDTEQADREAAIAARAWEIEFRLRKPYQHTVQPLFGAAAGGKAEVPIAVDFAGWLTESAIADIQIAAAVFLASARDAAIYRYSIARAQAEQRLRDRPPATVASLAAADRSVAACYEQGNL